MDSERNRATEMGYECPILPSFHATNLMYHKNLSEILHKISQYGIQNKCVAVMVATNNENSIIYTLQQ